MARMLRGIIQHQAGERVRQRASKLSDNNRGIDAAFKDKGVQGAAGGKPSVLTGQLLALGTSMHVPTGCQV